MSKKEKKWRAQHKGILQRVLELCQSCDGSGMDIRSEPSKGDLLKICADAYTGRFCGEEVGYYVDDRKPEFEPVQPLRPQIRGKTICDRAIEVGFVTSDWDSGTQRCQLMTQVKESWDAWVYAWDHQPRKRRVPRRMKRGQANGNRSSDG